MYGIDFGTSNTVVSAGAGGDSRLVDLGGGETVLPSLMFFERDCPVSVGAAAIRDYAAALEKNRRARDLYRHFRLFQALKLALKDEYFEGSNIFGNYVKAETLVGLFLREVKRRADASLGQADGSVVLGRPVRLSPKPDKEAFIQARFAAACATAGFDEVHFVMEPVAAMASLIGGVKGNTLVFDFGGGTLDITVARVMDDGVEILANDGVDLGGYILDEDLSRGRIIRHFGYGGHLRTMTGRRLEIPGWITNQVASFYALPLGDVVKAKETIQDMIFEADRKNALKGLVEFLDRNLSFGLFEKIDEAKITLSSRERASIAFSVPPYVAFDETIDRPDFEAMIAPRVAAAEKVTLGTVAAAGLEPGDVAHVVRVGGSCRIPAFVRMLEKHFPARVREGEVFTSISAGLIAAHRLGLGCDSAA